MENTILNKMIKGKINFFELYKIISKKNYIDEVIMLLMGLVSASILIFMQKNNLIFYGSLFLFILASFCIFFDIKELKIKNKIKKSIKKIKPNFFDNYTEKNFLYTVIDELSFNEVNNNIKIIYEYCKNNDLQFYLLNYLFEKKYLKDNILDYMLLNNPELFNFIFFGTKRTNDEINEGLIFIFKDLSKNILEEKKEEIYSILIEKNIFNVYYNMKKEERSVDLEIIEFLESFNYRDRNLLKLKEDNGFNILNQFIDKEKIMVF